MWRSAPGWRVWVSCFWWVPRARVETFPGFAECVNPAAVPDLVLGSILEFGSLGFGELSEKVCNSIVDKGVSLCKSQVKTAAKCEDKSASKIQDILLKQCAQLSESSDRSECKAGVKGEVDAVKDEMNADKETGIASCEGSVADAIASACDRDQDVRAA